MLHGCHRNGLTSCRLERRLSARLCTDLGRWFGRQLSCRFDTRLGRRFGRFQRGMQPLRQVDLFWDILRKIQLPIKTPLDNALRDP